MPEFISETIRQLWLRYGEYVPLGFAAGISSFIITPIIGYISRKLRIVDLPANLRRKTDETWARRRRDGRVNLMMGGIAVVLPFLIISSLYLGLDGKILGFMVAVLFLAIVGLIDDVLDLSAKVQLLAQVIAALIIVISGIGFDVLNNPLGGTIDLAWLTIPFDFLSFHLEITLVSDLIVFVWILVVINAVKWTGGTDALMEGNVAISALIFFLVSVKLGSYETAVLGIVLFGAMMGFLPFNFYPARILSTSCGKSVYGFILAVLAVLSGAKFAVSLLLLTLPLLDLFWVIFSRLIIYRPKNPLELISISDKLHLHYRLQSLGLTDRKVAYVYYLITGTLGVIAFAFTGFWKAVFLMAAVLVVGMGLVTLAALSRRDLALMRRVYEGRKEMRKNEGNSRKGN